MPFWRVINLKRLKTFFVFFLILISTFLIPTVVSAQSTYSEIPVESYTYWEDVGDSGRKAVYTQPLYAVKTVLSSMSLGIETLNGLSSICTDNKGNIYLLDGSSSRLIIIDENYMVLKEINKIKNGSEELEFKGAKDVFVSSNGLIYVCDTENKRVLIFDKDANLKNILTVPNSPLIPENYNFAPICSAVDSSGYVYVLCDGSYYGAILYTPEYEFVGFYGSNKVKNNVTQAISTMFSRLFVNNAKKSVSESVLPYCFVDISIDSNDFIYTATGYTDIDGMRGQIKKLSPGYGTNIIESETVNFADDGSNWTFKPGQMLRQDIGAVAVDEYGFIYCLDTTYGRVYLYDEQCKMLSAFGGGIGTGKQNGLFKQATSIALHGSDVLVCDSEKKTVTVLCETEYGTSFKTARVKTLSGKYTESKELWEYVLEKDSNCQLAYSGLARAELAEENYSKALEYAKQGYDRDTYDLAFGKVRTEFITRNFTWLLVVGIILIVGVLVFMVISMKKKIEIIKNKKLRLLFETLIHPVETFDVIKYKKQGSILIGAILLVVYYIVTVLVDLCGGFSFTYVDLASYNSFWVFVRSVGIVALWIICNKAVTTLMDGKGKTKDIFIVSTYSLVPTIIGRFVYLIFSNVLVSNEAEFLNIFYWAMIFYTLLLLVIGTIRIHDYGMGKFLGTSLLSVLGMAIVVFLIIMVFILSQQFVGFLATLFLEII